MNLYSKDIKQQKLEELKNIFPEIFKDNTIDYAQLKDILDEVSEESKAEHYNFNWFGKKDCYKTIKAKTSSTLKVDSDDTIPDGDNVFIEGDNLEVLKLLQHSYHKKVKMIYIDPPYNKDKDFVYKDTWSDTIQNYKIQTDQLRDEGYTSTKTSSTGRRHTNWLNMIYPRLWLSRNLLRDDGIIFVSIDDDEVHNLRKVMDEIYGEENFLTTIMWKRKKEISNDSKNVAIQGKYILIYAKSDESSLSLEPLSKEYIDKSYKYPTVEFPLGKWRPVPITVSKGLKGGGYNYIISAYGIQHDKLWAYPEKSYLKLLEEKRIYFGKNQDAIPQRVIYDFESLGKPISNFWENIATNKEGKKEILEIFNNHNYFDTPKPTKLIKKFLKQATTKNDIILDFFAGSGTTAHAVMDLNQEDGGNRKYILVQLPESTDEKSEAYKAGYKKISDITKERIKKVITKLDYKDGFKSFYLDNSNFQVFKEVIKRPNETLEEIEKMLKISMFHENILTQGAKELDLVYEVGLKNGFTLSANYKELQKNTYNFIVLEEENREFYFCFDKEIGNDIVHSIAKDAKLICYEKALGDSVKLNLHHNLDLETL